MQSRHGFRQLSYMNELGMGNGRYILIDLDNGECICTCIVNLTGIYAIGEINNVTGISVCICVNLSLDAIVSIVCRIAGRSVEAPGKVNNLGNDHVFMLKLFTYENVVGVIDSFYGDSVFIRADICIPTVLFLVVNRRINGYTDLRIVIPALKIVESRLGFVYESTQCNLCRKINALRCFLCVHIPTEKR